VLRDEIKNKGIDHINIHIQALERMIEFFEEYERVNGEDEYVTERINYLNNTYAEYKVASILKLEDLETTVPAEGN
jgi:hypothetical protein